MVALVTAMRFSLVLLVAAGCNQALGIGGSELAVDAPNGGEQDDCAPMPYDPHRYGFKYYASGGTWSEARNGCAAYGMDLVVIDENDADEIANELAAGGVFPHWVGVSRGTGSWQSVDRCTPLLDWIPGSEPSSEAPGTCALRAPNGLASSSCASPTGLNSLAISAMCETPRPSAACRAMDRASRATLVPVTGNVNYAEAEAVCAGQGAHIVEVNSTEELERLKLLAPGLNYWVVAKWTQPGWTGSTSCPMVFSWHALEPDRGIGGGFGCVAVTTGAMAPTECSTRVSSLICETN